MRITADFAIDDSFIGSSIDMAWERSERGLVSAALPVH
ncbi:hypothetical protein SRABI83_00070 [Arthrobacter sp. Bi83]|nr:hypothetical protein SRABI83_00070 [Arthrobacter sp. Bi83]